MKVLTLDVGNTSVDVCLYEGELRYIGKFEHDKVPYIEADLVLVGTLILSIYIVYITLHTG